MRTVIGGIIGAVAGFVVGGPMGAVVGAGIGAGLGAMATPMKIQGAKVGEEELASVQSGTPIGIILGEGGIKGDLLWQGPRKIVKVEEEQGGKGASTTVENQEVQRDYAIHFCESNARRGTKIRSVKIVRRNKIIVYDTRPESMLSGADNAKFMANVTFYFGDADQGADPTYEAHFGHLGAPAYRNQFTMVVRQHLLGKFGNAIPTYEVITCGGPIEDEDAGLEEWRWLGTGDTGAGNRASVRPMSIDMEWIGPSDVAVTSVNTTVNEALVRLGDRVFALVDDDTCRVADIATITTWNPGPTGLTLDDGLGHASAFGGRLWVACGSSGLAYLDGPGAAAFITLTNMLAYFPSSAAVMAVTGTGTNVLCMNRYGAFVRSSDSGMTWTAGADIFGSGNRFYTSYGALDSNGARIVVAGGESGLRAAYSDDNGATFIDCGLPVTSGQLANQVRYCSENRWLIACRDNETASDGLFKSIDNGETFTAVTLPDAVEFIIQSNQSIAADKASGRVVVAGVELVTELRKFYYSGDLDVWNTIDMTSTASRGISEVYPSGDGSLTLPNLTDDDVELPDATGHYVDKYQGTYSGRDTAYVPDPAHDCSMTLASVIRVLSQRTQVPPEILDVSRVEDIVVRGVSFRETGPVRKAIDTFAELYQFDVADSGGGIVVVPRGGAIDVVIEDGDILLSTKEVTKKKRGQQSEFPKIATLRYVDPTQSFEESSQRSVIKSKDFRATGEKTFTVSVTMTPDEAATQITRIHAEMQDQLEGSAQFDLPLKYLAVIPSAVISYLGKRYRVTKRRVEPWKVIVDAAVYDRASTYRLTAQGTVTGHTPTPQSDLVGPTMFAPMNMPVAIDSYDRPCLHAVVQGVSPGWRGADIYIKRGTGAYELTVSNMSPGVMGELTDSIDALSARGIDYGQTLKFKLYANGEAESIMFDELLQEKNPFALLKPDYTTSIGQFINATEVDPQMYEATGLSWGGLDTSAGSFAAGTKIAFLSKVQMIPLRASDLGQTIKVKAVSRGSAIETAPEHTITLTTMESLREWQPYFIKVTVNSDGSICVEWIGRARLGTSRSPIHSQWFQDYEVKFDIGSTSYTEYTTEQSLCVSAATLAEAFPNGYVTPAVTVRARSKVVTDDGDAGSPPGSPTTDPNPSYPVTIVGEPGDMYEGEGVLDYLGPLTYISPSPPFQAYGGKLEERFVGEIVGNVTCQSVWPGAGFMVGTPLTAETRDADTTILASGPDVSGGPYTITDSVTVLPMPAFAMMDELKPWGEKKLITPVTSPPRSAKQISSVGLGGLKSRVGFSSGQRRCEFIIDNMPAGGRIAIGVLAAGASAFLAPGTGGTFAHIVTGNGTFAVEVDASTGDVEVFELGVGLVTSGTLPLTYAHDGKYRFAWVANDAQHPAASAAVHTNQGNESWAITPTAGFGGVPNEANVIPCGFDAEVGTANGYWLTGTTSLTHATSGGFSGLSVVYAYSAFAKSAGKWRIGMGGATNGVARIGLCKDGHTGLLGQGGDSFGMSYDFSVIGSPQLVFDTTWAGQIRIPHPFYTMDRKIIFVYDFDAHTVEVWGKPQFSDYILLTVLTGLPGGAWVPAGNHAVELINGASEVSGATDWSLTKTP